MLLAAALGALAAAWAPGSTQAASTRAAAFTGPTNFPAGTIPSSVAVGDFNGDSHPDLAVANYVSNDVSILLGGVGGGFTAAAGSPLAAGTSPRSVAVGDFNGDSDPDLAVANTGSGDVSILLGGAGASFTPAAGSPLAAGSFPHSVAVGDFNGDSELDLAIANFFSGDVSILLGGAGASFTLAPGSPFAAGSFPEAVAVGDFNGDSDPDLAVTNYNASAHVFSNHISILLGGAGGGFTPAPGSPVVVGTNPQSVAVGDFNGDSDPDLGVANTITNDVSILLGGAGASFTPAAGSPVPVGPNPVSIAVGDFNGDSDPDLVTANEDSANVSVLLGGADASFTPAAGSPFDAGFGPFSVAVGDFNGDGKLDLAVANYGSNDVSILLGTTQNDDLSPHATCTITGTNRDDVLFGSPADDVICAGNGDDRLYGGGGRDVLIGGNGEDRLEGGEGSDLLLGQNGKDELRGDAGNDALWGGQGKDSLAGGTGSDALFGGGAPDSCLFDPADFVASCP